MNTQCFFYRQTISVSMWYFLNTMRAACGQWSDANSIEDLHIRKINYDTKTAGIVRFNLIALSKYQIVPITFQE